MGPMVPPGKYTAVLSVGNKSYRQDFEILMDPKVEADGMTADLYQKQSAIQQQVIDLLSEARQLQQQLEKELKNLKDKERRVKLETALKTLKNDSGAYPQQMLVAQISYLYNMVNGPDQVIGKDTMHRYEELKEQLKGVRERAQ